MQFNNVNNTDLLTTIINRKVDIIRCVNNILKDTQLSEDIYQETFIKCKVELDKGVYGEENRPYHYAVRIASNMAIDVLRKKKRNRVHSTDYFDNAAHTDHKQSKLIKYEIDHQVLQLIQLLSDDQRELVVLRLYHKMSYREIAQLTNTSINTLSGRMRYALINIRKISIEHNLSLN